MSCEYGDIERSFARLRKASALLAKASLCTIVVWAILGIVASVLYFQSSVASVKSGSLQAFEAAASCFMLVFSQVCWLSVFAFLHRFFRRLVEGESPFGERSVRLVRFVAAAFLLNGLCELLSPSVAVVAFADSGRLLELATEGYPLFHIDVTVFLSAAVLFALSFAFSYGAKLQELSDSTV